VVPADVDASDGELRVVPIDPGATDAAERTDRAVSDGAVVVADTAKGRAALSALRDATQHYIDRRMADEPNQTAAFPVIVTLEYASREASTGAPAGGSDDGTGSADGGTDGTPSEDDDADGDGGGGVDFGSRLPGPGLGGLFATGTSGSPASVQPPFPFASLILAFAFLIPLNFVIQAYGSTVLDERINRRGELLLVAPIAPGDIVAGKTLPYLLGTILVTVVIAALVGGSLLSVAAMLPVALVFLSATFVGGMFARSFKELTFVTVTISVALTSYAFVPAIFTEVTPIALISPLTLVVRDLSNVVVTPGQYAFSTGPVYLVAVLLFLLGTGIYREEDMFTQRSVPLKLLDALDAQLSGRASVALLSALSIPFVFVAELLVVALLFALPLSLSLPVLFVAIAAVEEVAKSLHVYAGFRTARFESSLASALGLGALSGLGFFVGEKTTAVVQAVGLTELPLGRAAFAPAGIGLTGAVALLFAPLVLHAVTAAISAVGASRRRRAWYVGALAVAIAVHALYNLSVVVLLA
jgi:ABC-type Na+ efflux pump permease subunit